MFLQHRAHAAQQMRDGPEKKIILVKYSCSLIVLFIKIQFYKWPKIEVSSN